MRRLLILAAVGLVVLVAAYCVYWFVLTRIVAADIAKWRDQQRALGYTVTIAEQPAIDGFPFSLRAQLGPPDIAAPGGLWHWQGPDTDLRLAPWAPLDLVFTAPGHHHLSLAGIAPRDVAIDADKLAFELDLDKRGQASDFGLRLTGATLADSIAGTTTVASAMIQGHLPWPATPGPEVSSLDLSADATGLNLPAGLRAALGQRIDKIHVVTQLMGAVPAAPPLEALAGWRDGGGVIQLREGEIDWGPISASGDGTIALDEKLQPLTAGTMRVAGLPETLDMLAAAGTVPQGQATLAKLMFGAVAATPTGGGRPEVALPLTIQNGYVYVGPIKLAPLQPIDWNQILIYFNGR
jgi:hypothetical protein